MTKSHCVTLLNQKLVVRSDASEDYVGRIAEYVAAKIQEVTGRSKGSSTLTSALLVSLNIADELFQSRSLQGVEKTKLSEKVKDLIDLIETHLLFENSPVLQVMGSMSLEPKTSNGDRH